jgi:hypothetical protein
MFLGAWTTISAGITFSINTIPLRPTGSDIDKSKGRYKSTYLIYIFWSLRRLKKVSAPQI